ncbi:MAG: DUF4974 domain-containing protein [Bacteroidota bacterium]
MPGKKRYPVIILFVFLFLLLQVRVVVAQQQPFLSKRVSFSFSDMPLSSVLHVIGNRTGVKFSYNPELVQSGRRINRKFTNTPLSEVLKQLLNDPTISFREIGNQIVLYRGDPSLIPLEPNQSLIVGKPQILASQKKMPDTIFIYRLDTLIINRTDTVFHSVSIIHLDTIRMTDTVFVEKSKPTQKPGKDLRNNFNKNSVKHRKFLENNGFYSGLYFEILPGSASYTSGAPESQDYLSLLQQSNAATMTKYSAGVVAGYDYLLVGIRTGVGFTSLGEKFDYSFNLETGGFFKTDTVERYYTLTGIDTSWFYITDSSWIPKDNKKYTYQNPNSYKYIDVPLALKFRFWQNESIEIYAMAGFNAAFLVSVDAMHITAGDSHLVVKAERSEMNNVLFSWHAGMGSAIKLTPRSGILAEVCYRKQTNSQFKNSEIKKQYGLMGLKIGAYVKF